ncbi:MmcQ/YjbR family DNA-binding protein [Marinirhabdus gelatinilytica]|uniref:Putative DNA-binding protein (MmcQ/YjbR family) n=1 Tax=Marinirhabdus gelatinilytica TaxID=1703343 RepID=A0A370QKJ1_9FLAO|nr:MmcQ/YjbR family DNA-binding protein [Marinirhabdus gelatinilytica]RDK88894.1 putative DNA-binding protein (MmcQ/YjbR family) [Marinirhabdus gelatinilytica]
MNIEKLRDYCLAKKGVTESLPFGPDTLVFKVMNKMFAICGLERTPTQVNLKCDPERSEELREAYDGLIIPGWHMNKHHWNTVFIEDIPPKLVVELIDHSYNLIVASLTKKLQAELAAL